MRKINTEGITLNTNDFAIIPTEVMIELITVLRKSELLLFGKLLRYLPSNSSILMRRDRPKEYVTLNYLVNDMKNPDGKPEYSKQVLKNLMTELRKNDVIKSVELQDSGLCYLINPWVAHGKTKNLDDVAFNVFKDSRWRSIPR